MRPADRNGATTRPDDARAERVKTIASLDNGHDNHFNLIRMLAAAAVLVSHSYPLASGMGTPEPLQDSLGITLGTLAVLVFFSVSGYFVSASLARSRSLLDFVAARALRIYPALLVVLLATVLAIGPALTTLWKGEYFTHPQTWSYLTHNLLLKDPQWALPGVLVAAPFPQSINGSLWTLFYEASCYALLAGAGLLGLTSSRGRFALLLVAYLGAYAAYKLTTLRAPDSLDFQTATFFKFSLAFVVGMSCHALRDRLPLSPWLAAAGVALAWLCHGSALQYEALVLCTGYLTLLIGFGKQPLLLRYNRLGDYSYGAYITAFPVQQLCVHLLPGIAPLQLMAIALPITLGLAVLSWHAIEKPALALRKRLFAPQPALAGSSAEA